MTRGLFPHVLESIHRIHLLSTQHLTAAKWVLKNSKRGGGIIQISQKEKFFSLMKSYVLFGVISSCITLSCSFQKRPSSFLHFGQVENIHSTYLKKTFWFVLVPYPHSLILCNFSLFSHYFLMLVLGSTLFPQIYTGTENWDFECCSWLGFPIFPNWWNSQLEFSRLNSAW